MRCLGRRRLRWAVPASVIGAIALGTWVPTIAASASTPTLPPITAAQLLAKAAHPNLDAFSGSIELTANLGLPDVGGLLSEGGQSAHSASGFDPTTLLSGTHQILVWDNGADQQRLALPSSLAETDFVHNGDNAYVYDSSTQTVTNLVAAPGAGDRPGEEGAEPSGAATAAGSVAMTPDQVAQQFLDHLDGSTRVTVASPVYVAGRPSYQLQLAPAAGSPGAEASTISDVTIDVDSASGAVLSVTVGAKAQSAPALKVAFTSFDPSSPSASNFAAPTGTTTKTETVGGVHGNGQADGNGQVDGRRPTSAVSGGPWAQIATFSGVELGRWGPELNSASTPVSGAFGQARLVTTAVLSVLVFPDGRVLAGFVTPAVLEAAAAA